ncbi:hypothetical protein JCM3774_004925 [Rhodotorula dairenensis]
MNLIGSSKWSVKFVFRNLIVNDTSGNSSSKIGLPEPVKIGAICRVLPSVTRSKALKCLSDVYRERCIILVFSAILPHLNAAEDSVDRQRIDRASPLGTSSPVQNESQSAPVPPETTVQSVTTDSFERASQELNNLLESVDAGKGDPEAVRAAEDILLALDAVRSG